MDSWRRIMVSFQGRRLHYFNVCKKFLPAELPYNIDILKLNSERGTIAGPWMARLSINQERTMKKWLLAGFLSIFSLQGLAQSAPDSVHESWYPGLKKALA
jgi:hypothetical protein